jgi:hypothetical protein
MPATYEPIATTTLGSATSTITFSSIPATYTDLRVVLVGTSTSAGFVVFRFNGDTATNYSYTELYGDGTSAASQGSSSNSRIGLGGTAAGINSSATIPSLYTIDVFSYAGSTFKTTLNTSSGDFNGSGGVERNIGMYRSTSAITAINLVAGTSFGIGTTATLYGILKA